ncbi:MAG TPA: hypothetical protein VFA07_04415 [Chthonomonadaceae bacterium]|nr:hypothetical protein [Chthonomonadaceae bacterium]
MRRRKCLFFGAVVLAVGLGIAPMAAGAQGTGSSNNTSSATSLADKRVTIDFEDIALTAAIRQLMNSVHASYTLDNALGAARVTAHLTDVRLDTALDMLMKVSSVPAEYQEEQGVYVFSRRKEQVQTVATALTGQKTPEQTSLPRYEKIQVNFVDAGALAQLLGGRAVYMGFNSFGIIDEGALRNQWGVSGIGAGNGGGLFGGGTILGNAGSGLGGKP